jgi:hypothetical protein
MLRLLFVLMFAMPMAWSAPDKNEKKTVQRSRAGDQSITGCLDQQGETYVLRELTAARAVTTLRGKGFSDDNFARYVGHKVTIHGNMEKQGDSSVFNVTKVDDAGPGCSNP